MFEIEWPGTTIGCEVTDPKTNVTSVMTVGQYAIIYGDNDDADFPCSRIAMESPKLQQNTFNKYICGKQSGTPFIKVTRVDPDTMKCPNSTIACSEATSPDYTVCVNSTDTANCPVTGLKFINTTPIPLNWTKAAGNAFMVGGYELIYTKNYNSNAITSTRLES